jgi:putative membrane protein
MRIGAIPSCAFSFAVLALSGIASAASLSNADKQFLITVAQSDMTEAHEGQMAQNQAGRADVKDLGKTLATDSAHSYEELSSLAAKNSVAIPKGINTAKIHSVQQLAHLKGNRFDVLYTKDEIAAQKRAVAMFKREAEHGRDADVKAWASKMLPVVEKHLQLVEQSSKASRKS